MPFGIDVTIVQPGNVATDFTSSRRLVAGALGDQVYGDTSTRAIDKMATDEAAGVSPTAVAARVARVLEERRPPRRVSVGAPGDRLGPVAKRLLPFRVFERLSRYALGVEIGRASCRERV